MINNFKDKRILFFSDSDLDGVCSQIVYRHLIHNITKSSIYTISSKRNMEDFSFEDLDKSEIVIFVDIAPTPDLYKLIKSKGKEVYLFDHHERGENGYFNLKDIITENYFYSTESCGAKIFLKELTKGLRVNRVLSQLVELCNVYDLWQEQSLLWKDARNLNNVMYGYVDWSQDKDSPTKYEGFVLEQLRKIKENSYFFFTGSEEDKIEKALQKEKNALREAKKGLQIRQDSYGNYYGYFESMSKLSYVSNQILKEMEKLRYIIGHSTFNDRGGINPQISIRSISERVMDVSKIAEKWGGGGHPTSSGVVFENMSDFLKLQKGIIHLI